MQISIPQLAILVVSKKVEGPRARELSRFPRGIDSHTRLPSFPALKACRSLLVLNLGEIQRDSRRLCGLKLLSLLELLLGFFFGHVVLLTWIAPAGGCRDWCNSSPKPAGTTLAG